MYGGVYFVPVHDLGPIPGARPTQSGRLGAHCDPEPDKN